jgi:hypothetical protein
MYDSMDEIISAAARRSGQATDTDTLAKQVPVTPPAPPAPFKDPGTTRGIEAPTVTALDRAARQPRLRPVNTNAAETRQNSAIPASAESMASIKPPILSIVSSGENSQDGPGELRLAFWLHGFYDALMQRRRQGEQLTDSEELLIERSSNDFASMRPFVIRTTLERLNGLVNAPELIIGPEESTAGGTGAMEVFALATLRGLSDRACALLQSDGPDAALSLFGESGGLLSPLAIYQLVFGTALDLIEAFERIIKIEARMLGRLAEALDSEVERL